VTPYGDDILPPTTLHGIKTQKTSVWKEIAPKWTLYRNNLPAGGEITHKEGVDWIDMAQDRAQWRALTNIKNFRVPWNAGNFCTS
jgi:hypothetical protein